MDKKISELDLVSSVDTNDVLPIVNLGSTKKVKVSQLVTNDLSYTASPTNGIVVSDKGTDATIPLANDINAGLLTPSEKTLIATIPNINTNAIEKVTVKLSESITKGQAVYVSGANGTNILVSKASNTAEATSSKTLGLLETTGVTNDIVNVITDGLLTGLNTSTATIGDAVWLGVNGDLIFWHYGQTTKPIAPAHLVYIGVVTRVSATVGEIFIKVQNGFELDEIHNVLISTPTNEDFLQYESSTSLWKNIQLTASWIKSKLGITTLSGDNTGDETTSTIKTKLGITTLSGSNTGDNATNSQYSGLATSKQDTLVSTVNIKSINGATILGSGDLVVSGAGISSLNGLTGATQTFSILTGTTSGSPSFVSSGTNHQLRLPSASSSVDYGLITNTSQYIAGSKIFLNAIAIPAPVPANSIGVRCIVLGDDGGNLIVGSTTYYPDSQEMQRVKGVTSNVQTQLNSKIDGFNVASQAYTGATPTWSGTTAPSGTTNHTYSWSRIGNVVVLRVSLDYSTAGSGLTAVTFDLPSDCPSPELPSGVSSIGDVISYGSGMLTTNRNIPLTPTASYACIRIKSSGVYEINIGRSSASTYKYAYATIQYFAQ